MSKRNLVFLFLIVVCCPLYAGAGGTSGKGDGGAGLIVIILLLPYLIGQGTYFYLIRKRSKNDAWRIISESNNTDVIWKHEKLIAHVDDVFHKLQDYWSLNNVDGSKRYLHPSYKNKYCKLMYDYSSRKQFNKITSVSVQRIDIVQAQNYIDDSLDMFVAHITGTMDDKIVTYGGDLVSNQGDDGKPGRSIDEYWYFQRKGEKWLLCNINQKHCSLFDVSVNEENPSVMRSDELWNAATASKKKYVIISFLIGCGITTVGYLAYAAIIGAVFNLF
ncbi:hypothetical protein [Candidatus Uabimicrobium sp. HlEnr_7]|uniref:hypothetical protein n=1 Tax=Candidatus Uabimicrobium helgolandensis TaxID=3095367 RepID=UPI003557B42F